MIIVVLMSYVHCECAGDFYGQGQVRRRELVKSAAVLGIDEDHVTIIDDTNLPDDPSVEWNGNLIGSYITEMISRHGIKTVSTLVAYNPTLQSLLITVPISLIARHSRAWLRLAVMRLGSIHKVGGAFILWDSDITLYMSVFVYICLFINATQN